MITLKQVDGGEVTPKDDGLFNDFLINQNGIFEGCTVTHLGANQLKIATGRGMVKGRNFVVSEETILATLAETGNKKGRLLIKIDLSNTGNPIQFITQCVDTLPDLTQEDLNRGGNVFELPLATYDVGTTTITNLLSVYPTISATTVTPSEKNGWNTHIANTTIHVTAEEKEIYGNKSASAITAGTFSGQVNANATAAETVTASQVRNIYAGTADMTAGTTALTSGTIYLVYE